MKENKFQAGLKKKLKTMFPGCIVTKLDSSDIQGIPDLLVLYKDKWAALEVKKEAKASHRPNQDYYVEKMDEMSFSRFIFPENEEDVLNELRETFKS
uniref:Nuclease n=1 Tax=Siphoviridae sp. ctmYS12 TaxID=2825652 RepID=A0A8S5P782_9CAUD|nr:MAG TPA: Nuclease [Siphoviridae sp. ctmYS12]